MFKVVYLYYWFTLILKIRNFKIVKMLIGGKYRIFKVPKVVNSKFLKLKSCKSQSRINLSLNSVLIQL